MSSYKDPTYFSNVRYELINMISKTGVKQVLSLGCGYGYTEYKLVKHNIEVWAVEKDHSAATEAMKNIPHVIIGDACEVSDKFPDQYFDCLLMADILEHLVDPLSTLKIYLDKLRDGGVVIASLPNVRYAGVLIPLILLGRWDYSDGGVLDNTHLRFFTKKTIKELFVDAGCSNINIRPRYSAPKAKYRKWIAMIIQPIIFKIPVLKDIFSKQYLVSALWSNQAIPD